MERTPPVVEMEGITKVYPGGVVANRGATLRVAAAEVHALIGENGAGKSTLMKILYGVEQPTAGTIRIDGRPNRIASPTEAIRLGIGMVFQHFSLVPSFSVAENVVLGAEPTRGGGLDARAATDAVADLAERFGLAVDPRARVGALPVGQQQRVEILKALYRDARVLILDEPTAVLTPQEVEDLFAAVRALAARGRTVILIAHKLPEVMAISQAITVMRHGRVVGALRTAEANEADVARLMVGREVFLQVEREPATPGAVVCAVEGLSALRDNGAPALTDVSLSARSGEILGVAAVEGNGQSELLEVLSGLRRPVAGRVEVGGEAADGWSVRQFRHAGTGCIPEDRLVRGLAPAASVTENAVADRVDRPPFSRRGVLDRRRMRQAARDLVAAFDVRVRDVGLPAAALSGGNMQKLVVGRELSAAPRLLLASNPTRGIDVGATEFVWRNLVAARDRGAAVVLTSADLSELLALSDRIVVLFGGRVAAEFADPANLSQEDLGAAMLGLRQDAAADAVAT